MTENAQKSKRPRLNLTLNPISDREKQITDNVLERLLGIDGDADTSANNQQSSVSPVKLTSPVDLTGPVNLNSPVNLTDLKPQVSQAEEKSSSDLISEKIEKDQQLSPVKLTGHVKEEALGLSMTSPVDLTGPVNLNSPVNLTDLNTKNLWDLTEPINGHLRIPNTYLDSIASQLDPVENTVYLQLFRLSWGYGKDHCLIGMPRLAQRCNTSESSLHRAIRKLTEKNLVQKIAMQFGKGIDQGSVFRVIIPTGHVNLTRPVNLTGPSNLTPIKDLKKQSNINASNTDVRAMAEIIDQVRSENRGKNLPPSEVAALVKEECARRGVSWDTKVYSELVK